MSAKQRDPASLQAMQAEYLLSAIRGVQTPGGLYTLILDERTEASLLLVIPREKLLRIVTLVENLGARRKHQLFSTAIYLVSILRFSLSCMLADAQCGRYKAAHGLFLPILDAESDLHHAFNGLRFLGNPKVSHFFNNGQNVLWVEALLVPVEARVFLADSRTPNSMAIYYNENCGDLVLRQVRIAARALVTAVVAAGEYPLVRYYAPPDASHQALRLPELIADEFQRQIDDYARTHHDFPPVSSADKPRAIVVVTDRTLDLFAPLLHEFTYQAMAMDIVEGLERNGVYRYSAQNEKGEESQMLSSLDSEEDADWVLLRHLHIIESSELVVNKIGELIRANPLMVDRQKASTALELMYVVAHLQGFDTERRQITLHKTLIDECLDINAQRKLAEFAADFEQNCAASGLTFEGTRAKSLHDDLIVLLARDDLHVNDKMRLVLIYALFRGGLVEADFVKLARFIGVRDRQIISLVLRCFHNLHKLGCPIVKKDTKTKKVVKKQFHTINNDGTYNTSRFDPGLKNVLQSAAKYSLDEEWFPYFRDKPLEDDIPGARAGSGADSGPNSLRNPRIKASWAQSSNKVLTLGLIARPKQRVFCYVAGGVTYSEVRAIYELLAALNKDFYVGSETLLKPRDFLIGLQSIDQAKQVEDLDLSLYKDLLKPTEAPMYLFESDKPPVSAVPTYIPQMAELAPSPGVPNHYQKRLSRTLVQESLAQPEKGRRLKLKSLFK